MNYEDILARQPDSTTAGDRSAAGSFVEFLSLQIETGIGHLNGSQQRYIYKLRARWQVRTDGKDGRWNTHGTRAGRPFSKRTPKLSSTYKREEDDDPLLASILRKYGTPVRGDV